MANVSYSSCHLFLVIYERGDLPDTYKMDRYTYSSWFSIYKPRATPYVLIMSFSFLQKCTQWMKIEKNIIEYNFELFLWKRIFIFSQQRNRTETSFAILHIWINLFLWYVRGYKRHDGAYFMPLFVYPKLSPAKTNDLSSLSSLLMQFVSIWDSYLETREIMATIKMTHWVDS